MRRLNPLNFSYIKTIFALLLVWIWCLISVKGLKFVSVWGEFLTFDILVLKKDQLKLASDWLVTFKNSFKNKFSEICTNNIFAKFLVVDLKNEPLYQNQLTNLWPKFQNIIRIITRKYLHPPPHNFYQKGWR